MKNILFISIGTDAFGESILALNFARSLPAAGYRPCFILSPSHGTLLNQHPNFKGIQLYKGAIKINRMLIEDFLEHYPPDLIILCDFLTFDYSQADMGITLDDLRAYNKPIISLDSYEWESGDFGLDFFNGAEKKVPATILELDGALRPCPLNKPAPINGRIACYSFLHQIQQLPEEEVRWTRNELGIPMNDLVIFSATAVWQEFRAKKRYAGPFSRIVPQLIYSYVERLETPVHWISVGPHNRQAHTKQRGNVVEHNFPSLPEDKFNRLLAASDIMISTNIASTTLAKCIRYRRPALFLYNSLVVNGPGDFSKYKHIRLSESTSSLIENAYPFHPFLMFPLGWFKFLSPVLKDNPYLDTFYRAEILDEEGVLSLLRKAAEKKDQKLQERIEGYERLLADLPPPADCVEHFMRN